MFTIGMRVEAVELLTDSDDENYRVNPGDQGTVASIYMDGQAQSYDDMGVTWDKYPKSINSVYEHQIREVKTDS